MRLYNFFYNLVNKLWYRKKLNNICYIFIIFEVIFKLISYIRKNLYKYNILIKYKFNLPVIVVGNISVGGTGKTPLVIYIANYLSKQGFKPAIISRGYGSKLTNNISLVAINSDPMQFGDEAVMMANATNCPIIIGNDRILVINFILKNIANINVIISDDGLQYYKLVRNLEIAIIDGERQFGNGHCLPLGPLREPISRLKTVDLVVINGDSNVNLFYKNKFVLNLLPEKIYNILDPNIQKMPIDFTTKVHAVAGIGNNQRFFDLLKTLGFNIIIHEFPDHYVYQERDLCFNDDLPIIMTEKDAVKCVKFAKSNFWCQTVIVNINMVEEFNNYLIESLNHAK